MTCSFSAALSKDAEHALEAILMSEDDGIVKENSCRVTMLAQQFGKRVCDQNQGAVPPLLS